MNESRQLDLTREPLPRGFWLGLIPLLAMTAVTLYLATQWDRIPDRFPRHWDANGNANGWSEKTFIGVFGIPILFLTVGAWLWSFALAIWHGTRRTSVWRRPMFTILSLAVWPAAILHPMITLLPLTGEPSPVFAILSIGLFLAAVAGCVAYGIRQQRDLPQKAAFGGFHGKDASVLVEEEGHGLAFNFANPLSWLFLAWPLLLPLAIRMVVPMSPQLP